MSIEAISPRRRRAALALACVGALMVDARRAEACSAPRPAQPTAFPASGAAGVSPQSSIIVVRSAGLGGPLSLEVNGAAAPLPPMEPIGRGWAGDGPAEFLRLAGPLEPGAEYLLRAQVNGTPRELTRFQTAAAYDKAPGVAPRLDHLRVWRVRYPVNQIGAGGCVFAEYEGYVDFDYVPGQVPGTPGKELVHVVTLSPKTGGAPQTFVFAGQPVSEGGAVVPLPDGTGPEPTSLWKPSLEPDREYCVTMTLIGRNDLAAPPVQSNTVCARVESRAADGVSEGGCAVGRGRSGAPWAAALIGLLAFARGISRRRR